MIKFILPAIIVLFIVVFWEKITEVILKKFKKRNIKNPERIATAYVKGLTAGSKKKAAKNLVGIID